LKLPHDYDKLKRIGHFVAQIEVERKNAEDAEAQLRKEVECVARQRQAEAYRTFGCRVSLRLSVRRDHDKLKRIGQLNQIGCWLRVSI